MGTATEMAPKVSWIKQEIHKALPIQTEKNIKPDDLYGKGGSLKEGGGGWGGWGGGYSWIEGQMTSGRCDVIANLRPHWWMTAAIDHLKWPDRCLAALWAAQCRQSPERQQRKSVLSQVCRHERLNTLCVNYMSIPYVWIMYILCLYANCSGRCISLRSRSHADSPSQVPIPTPPHLWAMIPLKVSSCLKEFFRDLMLTVMCTHISWIAILQYFGNHMYHVILPSLSSRMTYSTSEEHLKLPCNRRP